MTEKFSLGKGFLTDITPEINSLIMSPDGKRIAYKAHKPDPSDKELVVVDGVEGKEYDGIGPNNPVFSPDSKRVAYQAWGKGKELLVIDGVECHVEGIQSQISKLIFDIQILFTF